MTITTPVLHVVRGMSCGPLTIFPVWTGAAAPTGLVTAKVAHLSVAEREDGPAVDQVVLTNARYQMALLLEGELLEGSSPGTSPSTHPRPYRAAAYNFDAPNLLRA